MQTRPSTKQKLVAAVQACTALRHSRDAGKITQREFEALFPVLEAIAEDYRAVFDRQAA